MTELEFGYWNQLAQQIIVISSLLGGFSIAVIANLLISEINTKLHKYIFAASTLAAGFFLITVFSITDIFLKTTEGYPRQISEGALEFPRLIGAGSFFFGIISLLVLISLSGFSKSRKLGYFTMIISLVTLIIILLMMSGS